MTLYIEMAGENEPTLCDCCGNLSKTIWGYIYDGENALAAYFVQWTQSRKEHFPSFDILLGTFGDDSANDKKLISFLYNATHEDGGSFMVVDSSNRPAAKSSLCSVALSREDVIMNRELMGVATSIIDAIWLGEPRIQEIKDFSKNP